MKILNLANEGSGTFGGDDDSLIKTDIRFKFKNFPDGQTDIVVNTDDLISPEPAVQITSHFNSWEDMVKIICATVALRKLNVFEIHLFIPYILGARSDRRFEKGGTSYLVDVVAPIINMQEFKSVTCFDAHSDVAQGCIQRLEIITNIELVKWAIDKIGTTNFRIAAPDQGATKKVFEVAHQLQIETPILFCVKHRDLKTGKILHTEVPLGTIVPNMDYIIVDDICDGGRTFIEIAKEIKRQYSNPEIQQLEKQIEELKEQKSIYVRVQEYEPAARLRLAERDAIEKLEELKKSSALKCRIFLVVSHGIFSNEFNELNRHLDGIFTTNSITCYGWSITPCNQAPKNLNVLDIIHTKINQNK